MNRRELDAFVAHHGLSVDGVEAALLASGARPGRETTRRFGVRMLSIAGVLSLAAGVVFFVAANWSVFGVFGRFALVEGALVGAASLALWRPPPDAVGRYALLLAFIVTGSLFALFGQTYQTGADVYELFLNWSLLGLIFVLAARWSVVLAAWTLVLNVALLLYCAARPEAGLLWRMIGAFELSLPYLLVLPLTLNVGMWAASARFEGSHGSGIAPAWLGRFVLAWGAVYGTWAGLLVIVDTAGSRGASFGLVVPLIVFAAVVLFTLKRRRDVFPLALVEASLIVLSTTWIVQYTDLDAIGTFFVIAAWLVLTSTVSGRYLMHLVRSWELEAGA